MDSLFKPPFSMIRVISVEPGELSIPFLLDEKPTVVPVGSAGEQSGAPERFDMAPLGRTQSERRRRLALASGFRLFRSFGIDRIGEPGHAAGRGRAGPDG